MASTTATQHQHRYSNSQSSSTTLATHRQSSSRMATITTSRIVEMSKNFYLTTSFEGRRPSAVATVEAALPPPYSADHDHAVEAETIQRDFALPNYAAAETTSPARQHLQHLLALRQLSSPGCPGGFRSVRGGTFYTTPLVPGLDVCPSCFHKHISGTRFDTHFTAEQKGVAEENTCDLALPALLTFWMDTDAEVRAGWGNRRPETYLEKFDEKYSAFMGSVKSLVTRIDGLGMQIEQLKATGKNVDAVVAEKQKEDERLWKALKRGLSIDF
ncbi:hypothetical protein MRB53_038013 [Persea americana]|nr:hypothetical protein MRB53_038013 [Persea americana]